MSLNRRFSYRFLKWICYMVYRFEKKMERVFKDFLIHILAERYLHNEGKLSLDIGCGIRGTGSVNCDPYPELNIHRRRDVIDCRAYEHYLMADAQKLPFRDKSFHYSRSAFVLEHLDDPLEALEEMSRVASERSVVKLLSHLEIEHDDTPSHLYSWTPSTFKNLLRRAFREANVFLVYNELIGVCVPR